MLERKGRDQTEEIRKQCHRGFKPLKQNAQKCMVSKFLFQIRECIKAQPE